MPPPTPNSPATSPATAADHHQAGPPSATKGEDQAWHPPGFYASLARLPALVPERAALALCRRSKNLILRLTYFPEKVVSHDAKHCCALPLCWVCCPASAPLPLTCICPPCPRLPQGWAPANRRCRARSPPISWPLAWRNWSMAPGPIRPGASRRFTRALRSFCLGA